MFSKFQCWRCDKVTSEGKKCSACGMAYYCTDRCRINDEFRHSTSECKDVAVRYVCHGCKKKTTEKMKMCTNCMKVWFCSGECMKRSWETHKIECKAISRATMELGIRLSQRDELTMSQLYFWGNTPALDLLNLSMNEGPKYSQPLSLLLCGVGDPRNVCLTISKLQDKEHQGKVTFVMNDICACTLARTVLLLYLLCKGGESKAKFITQIWYSLYLSEEDHVFVVECLRDLIQISNLEDLTRGIMKIEPAQLNELKNVWKTWLRLSREENAISRQRSQMFENEKNVQEYSFGIMSYIKEMPKKHQTSANDWLKNGVLSSERCRKHLVKENFTLLGLVFLLDSNTRSYKYAIPSDCLPFKCWDYRSVSAAYPDTDSLNEMYNDYITDVLRKTAARLQRDDIQLSFILCNCTDITPYLPEGITFDRITTSNLCDYVHLRDLLQLTKPLLNSSNNLAVIVTESQNWVQQFPNISLKKLGMFIGPDGSALIMKVLQDTGNKAIAESDGEHAFADYYSLVEEFTLFLRASFLNTTKYSGLKSTSLLPSVNQLAAELGLKPRDFTFRENKVAPFRWRLNTRRVTLLRGSELSVEWTLL